MSSMANITAVDLPGDSKTQGVKKTTKTNVVNAIYIQVVLLYDKSVVNLTVICIKVCCLCSRV